MPQWRVWVEQGLLAFVGTAAFPHLAYRLRWPTRLGPRGFLAYVAFNTTVLFAIRTWFIPYLKRMVAERERVEEVLRTQLGRKPTEDELLAALGISCDL